MKKKFLLAFALLLSTQVATAQNKLETKAQLLAGANSVFSGMCAEHREHAKNATSVTAIRLADEGVEMWCSCGPEEMEHLVRGLSEPISKEIALSTFTQAQSICTGKQLRKATKALCPTDQETIARVTNIDAYCACVTARLFAMTDEELHADFNAVYNKEMLDAKTSGRPLPYREAFALRKYGAGCETADFSMLKDSLLSSK